MRGCLATARPRCAIIVATAVLTAMISTTANAEEVKVAVAANFTAAAKEIGALFEKASGDKAVFSFGSTGQFYTQITQGAPFEVFLSADQARPKKAEKEGYAVPGSRFTYATGRIVLFSMDKNAVHGEATLKDAKFARIAICNPVTAPYGAASVETMKALGVYDQLQGKLVQGEDISQAYQFVFTGNAEVGFVALSQVARDPEKGSRWVVPSNLYRPIAQDAVLMKRGADNPAAKAFLAFLKGPEARVVIEKYGYGTGG
jgi:molybdate transport system substrate-binding protein